ncbi:GHMP kinase [candidate division KSB1 bacterium]|jgi:glucuronokinase|nr:GHMP kinase [candidate division KSB1 bacterium]
MIIRTRAYARAGLAGNPSDGYFGKTISVTLRNFYAEVTMYETPDLEIIPNERDHSYFENLDHLVKDVQLHGYYGGIRLIKAAAKKFHEYCEQKGIVLANKNFTVRYSSNIPVQVGMAGSSGIVTATMRALMTFYGVEIPKPMLPNLILSVETEELGISAGLQDRVVQVYDGMVFMDFDKKLMQTQGHGDYQCLDINLLPHIYLAYISDLSEISGIAHGNLRGRFEAGDPQVVEAMKFFANCAEEAKEVMLNHQPEKLGAIMNANFDKRREIFPISRKNLEMIDLARSCGASAKFSGSGGAIVGTYEDEAMFKRLKETLSEVGAVVIKPEF